MSLFRRGEPAPLSSLGPLESQVLRTLWTLTEPNPAGALARDVQEAIGPALAYTTVATTLDRLCKKNLLERTKRNRAFIYKPRYTRLQLDEREARQAIRNLGGGGQLISCLIDAVTPQDASLLDELEEKIRRKRREMKKAEKGGHA